jgi:hypothetical protein
MWTSGLFIFFSLLSLLPLSYSATYSPNSFLVLRVGDLPPNNKSLISSNGASLAAPIFIDEFDVDYAAQGPISSTRINGVTFAGNDWQHGDLTLSGNSGFATFAGLAAVEGYTTPSTCGSSPTAPPCFPFVKRVLVRIDWNKGISTSTSVDYNGIIKGTCSDDGLGFWTAGNGTTEIGYTLHGTSVMNHLHGRATDGFGFVGCYATSSGSIYFLRVSDSQYVYLDKVYKGIKTNTTIPFPDPLSATYISAAPYYGKALAVNKAETKIWYGSTSGFDNGIYYFGAAVGATPSPSPSAQSNTLSFSGFNQILNTGTSRFLITGLTLTRDESWLYFTTRSPTNSVYRISASCTLACLPVLMYSSPSSNVEYRGLSLVPTLPAAPSSTPSTTASATITPTSTPTGTVTLPAGLSPSNTPSALPPAFVQENLLVLRVGTAGFALNVKTTAINIDEINPISPLTNVRTISIPNTVSLSGTDYTQGTLSRVADGSAVIFAAINVGPGDTPLGSYPYYNNDRVIVRISRSGVVDTGTVISNVQYDGVIKGVCSFDGKGYYIVGNATTVGIGYIAHGAPSNTLTTVFNTHQYYCGCEAHLYDKTLFFVRNENDYVHVDEMVQADITPASFTGLSQSTYFNWAPFAGKTLVVNDNQDRYWVAVVSGEIPTDGGIWSGPSVTSMTIFQPTATVRPTGLALSPDETRLYFTAREPKHGLYWTVAICNTLPTTFCPYTLMRQAAAGEEYRGLTLTPMIQPSPSTQASQSPSNSPSATISVSNSQTPQPSVNAGVSPSSSSAPVANDFFLPTDLLAVRVGTGLSQLTAALAPVFIDQYSSTVAIAQVAPVRSEKVSRLTLSGTDWTQGGLTRCGDNTCVVFGGVLDAPEGTNPTANPPYFAYPRGVAHIGPAGFVSIKAAVPHTKFSGLIKGVCSLDAKGFFVVGNSTEMGMGYLADGQLDQVVDMYEPNNFGGCTMTMASNVYSIRSTNYVYVDRLRNPSPTEDFDFTPTNLFFSGTPYVGKQIIVNRAENKFWIGIDSKYSTADGGIWYGTGTPPNPNALFTGIAAPIVFSLAVDPLYVIVGLTLSADESKLFFATRQPDHAIYSIPATCTAYLTCPPTRIATAAPFTEFRGLALAPSKTKPVASVSPAALPSPSTSSTPSSSPRPSNVVISPPGPVGAGVAAAFTTTTNVVLLRSGTGSAALSSSAAELFIDEYSPSTRTAAGNIPHVQTFPVTGVTSAGTDAAGAQLSRSADGSFLFVAGLSATPGTAPGSGCPDGNSSGIAPGACFSSSKRVISRIDWTAKQNLIAELSSQVFTGIIKGVCSPDGQTIYIVGNTSNSGLSIITVQDPITAGSSLSSANIVTSGVSTVRLPLGKLTACVSTESKTTWALAEYNSVFAPISYVISAPRIGYESAEIGTITTAAGTTTATNKESMFIVSPKAMVHDPTGKSGAFYYIGDLDEGLNYAPRLNSGGAVYKCTSLVPSLASTMVIMYDLQGEAGVVGLALSPPSSTSDYTLYVATRKGLFSVLAKCGGYNLPCAPIQLVAAHPNTQYKGLALVPSAPKCPNGFQASTTGAKACVPVAFTCSTCPAGKFANTQCTGSVQTTCSSCPINTYSDAPSVNNACLTCPINSYSVEGQSTCICKAGFYRVSGRGSTLVCAACAANTWRGPNAGPDDTCAICTSCLASAKRYRSSVCTPTSDTVCATCPTGSYVVTDNSPTCRCREAGYTNEVGTGDSLTCCPAGSIYADLNKACVCNQGFFGTPSGSAAIVTSTLSCTACPINQYAYSLNSKTCAACPAGSTTNGLTGRAQCSCASGYYPSGAGAIVCKLCPPGATSISDTCKCKDPRARFDAIKNLCVCPPGFTTYYDPLLNGEAVCDPCDPGFYSNVEGAETCTPSAQGQYVDVFGATSVQFCSTGSVSVIGADECKCSDPQAYWQPNTCNCAPGRLQTGGAGTFLTINCGTCAAGFVQSQSGTGPTGLVCTSCPADQYSITAGSTAACLACPLGTTTRGLLGQSSCNFCIDGASFRTGSGSTASCVTCPVGSTPSVDGASCVCSDPIASWDGTSCKCGLGYSDSGTGTCTACPAGKIGVSIGGNTCNDCIGETYTNIAGKSVCASCPVGTTANAGKTGCICSDHSTFDPILNTCVCDIGFRKVGNVCSECASGYGSNGLTGPPMTCTACAIDTFSTGGTTACSSCAPSSSTGGLLGQSSCTCLPNYYLVGSVCTICPTGSISGTAWPNTCACIDPLALWIGGTCKCPKGFSQTGSSCTKCAAGTFSNIEGSATCTPCSTSPASFSRSGATSCTACGPGETSASGGATCQCNDPNADWSLNVNVLTNTATTVCTCKANYKQTGGGATGQPAVCTACPLGQSSVSGSATCAGCPINSNFSIATGTCQCIDGFYLVSGSGFTSVCARCPAGTYDAAYGGDISTCQPCPVGQGSPAGSPSVANCKACPLSATLINNECKCTATSAIYDVATNTCGCPAGFAQIMSNGTMTCRGCPSGKYALKGESVCSLCATSAKVGYLDPLTTLQNQDSCRCAANYYWSVGATRALDNCVSCPLNSVSNPGAKTCSCNAGFASLGTSGSSLTCTACSGVGFTSTIGSSTCFCAANYISSGSGTCSPCVAGTYSIANGASCLGCPAGTYSQGNGGPCLPCTAGKYSALGASTCLDCAANTYSRSGAATCTACGSPILGYGVGTQLGRPVCTCAVGYGFSMLSYTCAFCGAGSSNPSASEVCTCTDTSASWDPLSNTCACKTGFTSGGSSPVVCKACASTCPLGSFQTGPCTTYSDLSCSLCTICGPGTSMVSDCSSSNRVCTSCADGLYQDKDNSPTCKSCPAGSLPTFEKGSCICSSANSTFIPDGFDISGARCECLPGFVPSGSGVSLTCSAPPGGFSATPSKTPSITSTPSPSQTPSITSSITPTRSPGSVTPSPTISNTATPTRSPGSIAPSRTPTVSFSSASSFTPTSTISRSEKGGASRSVTPSTTRSKSPGPVVDVEGESKARAAAELQRATTYAGIGGGLGVIAIVIIGAAIYSHVSNKGKNKKLAKRNNSFGEIATSPSYGGDISPAVVSRNPLQRDNSERSQRSMRAASAGGSNTRASFAPQAVDVDDNFSEIRTEWMSCTDLAKGVTYYVNMQTKESVWTLPAGGIIVKRMSQ